MLIKVGDMTFHVKLVWRYVWQRNVRLGIKEREKKRIGREREEGREGKEREVRGRKSRRKRGRESERGRGRD